MKKTRSIQHVAGKASHELPGILTRQIGRVIVKYAYLDGIIQQTIWETVGVSGSVGRLAIREPRISEKLEMLRDLLTLEKASWNSELFESILERAKLISAKRHLIAHGIWDIIPGVSVMPDEWHVQLARGSWPKNLREMIAANKKVVPEMVEMNVAKLREATSELDQLIEDFRLFRLSAVEG